MCDSQTPCAMKRKHGRHLVSAQSGGSSDGTPGAGSGEAVYGFPPKLVRYLFYARPAVCGERVFVSRVGVVALYVVPRLRVLRCFSVGALVLP